MTQESIELLELQLKTIFNGAVEITRGTTAAGAAKVKALVQVVSITQFPLLVELSEAVRCKIGLFASGGFIYINFYPYDIS